MSDDYDVHLTSDGAPNGVGEYWWETPESIVAVPNELAQQILRGPGGFHQIEPKDLNLDGIKPIRKKTLVESLAPESVEPETEVTDKSPLEDALELTANAPQKAPTARKAARARKAT